jgi:hypothetical protein
MSSSREKVRLALNEFFERKLEQPRDARLLPAWFVPRMMQDAWSFGLLLTTGHVLCIETIERIRQAADGSLWLDVSMIRDVSFLREIWGKNLNLIGAPTDRLTASVNAAHVIWAFELADT